MIRVGGTIPIHTRENFFKELEKKIIRDCLKNMEFVEFWIEHPYGNSVLLKDDKFFERINELIEDKKVGVHAPVVLANILNPNRAVEKGILREHKDTVMIAKRLGAEYVVMHAGAYPFFLKKMDAVKLVLERLKIVSSYAESKGVKLAVENVPFSSGFMIPYGSKLNEISHLLRKIPGLGFVLDVPHLLFSGEDEITVEKIHMKRLVCLHMHDTDGKNDHLEIGKGIIEHEALLRSVLAEKDDLLINVEVVKPAEMYRSIKKIKKMVKKITSE